MAGAGIAAVLFDLDGTLVDSEGQTDAAIAAVMARRGGRLPSYLPPEETRGRTWGDIVLALAVRYGVPDLQATEQELVAHWSSSMDRIVPIPGAVEAVAAAAVFPRLVGVVSSSPRALVEHLLTAPLGVRERVSVVVGAEDVARPKPEPECFTLACTRLGVDAQRALVFEDSSAGLRAARAAGCRRVAVLCRCAEPALCRQLADGAIDDYRALTPAFWHALRDNPSAALASVRA